MIALEKIALSARKSSVDLAEMSEERKNSLLAAIEKAIATHRDEIQTANKIDCDRAEQDGLSPPLQKRLRFDAEKIDAVCRGIRSLIKLPDPVNRVLEARELDKGLRLYRKTTPIGTLGVIFESRPDALVQIATLCLKSGNSALLKGGVEAIETNRALTNIIVSAIKEAGVTSDCIYLLETRTDVKNILALDRYIDLIIPRGSNSFVRYIMDNTKIPVMGHADGVCHLYIDSGADLEMALRVSLDSKLQYVAVCNAVETILVHEDIARQFIPALADRLHTASVTIRACERSQAIISETLGEDCPWSQTAGESDWRAEYLDYLVALRVVDSIDTAIEHINHYGSHHTDSIVGTQEAAAYFMTRVDSSSVLHNCSTRFSDGFRYGLGAEVGISTGKLHARGPVGLDGLVSYKWYLHGSGHIVADYNDSTGRTLSHRALPLE